MSKKTFYFVIFIVIFGILGFFGFRVYADFYSIPSKAPSGEYSFIVEPGETLANVAKDLERDNVINSASTFLILNRINRTVDNLQAGEYTIALNNTSPQEVLEKIEQERFRIAQEIAEAANRPVVTLTFREGETLDEMIFSLSQEGVANYDDLISFAKDPINFDRTAYEFLPEPLDCEYGNIKTCARFYPEGYMYPDTYQFFLNSKPKDIFNRMLNNYDRKVWSVVKDEVSNFSEFQNVMILASVIEKETGRPATGVTKDLRDEVNEERKKMAQVFVNRKEINMKWQSDVTAEYGQFVIEGQGDEATFTKRKLCQQTFTIKDCIPLINNPNIDNKYNTYKISGAPIGPVTNPQLDNILAALNPIDNNYLFFVSDVTGKKYFSESDSQHQQTIIDVQKINQELKK